jgi:hypothetical protein
MASCQQCCTLGAMRNWLALALPLLVMSCAAHSGNSSSAHNGPSSAEVDLSSLTARERSDYNELVTSLLAPCPELPQSLSECVAKRSACNACTPASVFVRDSVSRGRTPPQVEGAFRIRFDPKSVVSIDTASSPQMGDPKAPVTIVEWADFECPFCARAGKMFEEVMKLRPGKVRLVYKYFPLTSHPHGELTAHAAAAADLQGKFWLMHDELFESQSSLDEAKIRDIAKKIGLDVVKFESDLNSEAVKARVDKDRGEADRLGLEGTPFVWVNGRHMDSKYFNPEDDLVPWIDLELQLLQAAVSSK